MLWNPIFGGVLNIYFLATSLCGDLGRLQRYGSARGVLAMLLLLGLTTYDPLAQAQTPLNDIHQVAAGASHACAITTGGGVKCWGANFRGQLGDGTTADRLTAVDVRGLGSGVSAIATGFGYSCGVTTAGGVKCWGSNFRGQLGDGTTEDRLTAVGVSGLSGGVIAIAAGSSHTCALTTGGGVKCWGNNGFGQLGNGSYTHSSTPVDVRELETGVIAIAAGQWHTCALTTGGGVKCWGMNWEGQLGDGTRTGSRTAVDVSGLSSGVSAIAAGESHTCALTTGTGVKCWGISGIVIQALTPVDVSGLESGISGISAGHAHTCALTIGGGVKCWGGNYRGQLGDGTTARRSTVVDVLGLSSGVNAIAAGEAHTCALITGGAVKCWGDNFYGQLGDNTTTVRLTAADVIGLGSGVNATTAGELHTCALTAVGGVKCWGGNSYGQLGDGSNTTRRAVVDVSDLSSGVSAITAGGLHTCALTASGGGKCWGNNAQGQLGDGTTSDRSTAVDISGLGSGVNAIAAGGSHTCALTTGGGVKCWGYNLAGQLGDGTTTDRSFAVDVSGLSGGASAIAAGGTHSCAIATGGAVKCWGSNFYGQLGDGTNTTRTVAADVIGLDSGVSALATGSTHTCALTAGGGVKCWGSNFYGQLGDGSTTDRLTAVDVGGLGSGVAAIAAGTFHTCALTSSGGVKCWGQNFDGQLGDDTTTGRVNAIDVNGLSSGIIAIAVGTRHSCALGVGGDLKCWGSHLHGQLGIGGRNYGLPGDVLTFDVFFNGFESEP
jgi:alpha-tubulin suppressor-like RCC1 family protein